jgi:hypothetical protein
VSVLVTDTLGSASGSRVSNGSDQGGFSSEDMANTDKQQNATDQQPSDATVLCASDGILRVRGRECHGKPPTVMLCTFLHQPGLVKQDFKLERTLFCERYERQG